MSFTGRISLVFLAAVFFSVFVVAQIQGGTIATCSLQSMPTQYDVIVIGGDAEGIAAAIGSARAGGHTLLIDTRPVPGGLLTRGWLNTIDLNLNRAGQPLNGGLFGEIFRELDDQSFDVASMEAILTRLIARERNLDVINGVLTVTPVIGSASVALFQPGQTLCPDNRKLPDRLVTDVRPLPRKQLAPVAVSGVEIYTDNGESLHVSGKRVIDATQDADFAVAAGAGWRAYGEDIWGTTRNMAITLIFRINNISDSDWQAMCMALSHQKSFGQLLGGKLKSIWGFGEIMQKYSSSNRRIHMRALNLGRQNDGSVLVNAMLIYAGNGLSRESRREARILAEAELPQLQDFMRKNIAGMTSASITGTAPELYVRTSRQIVSQYTLTVDDVLENRDFPDRIGFGSYPLDIQAQSPDQQGDVTGNPEQYAVPLRSLIPIGFTNLLVVGRCAGFDSLAQSSARTIPVGMAAGQAAGVAAIVSIRKNISFDRIASDSAAISELHSILKDQGVAVEPNPARPPAIIAHWAYPGLKFMRNRGQISGGYKNEYGLDKPMSGKAFVNRMVSLGPELKKQERKWLYDFGTSYDRLSPGLACNLLCCFDSLATGEQAILQQNSGMTHAVLLGWIQQQGLFNQSWPTEQIDLDGQLTCGAAYMLLASWAK
ncbi:MAG: FAD-dependent oxidoreductase [Candidatus Riflebacteria bacterium]|nr:FAD-dependent oxidoreductase [Candidatus Riflebacteria bacterium]